MSDNPNLRYLADVRVTELAGVRMPFWSAINFGCAFGLGLWLASIVLAAVLPILLIIFFIFSRLLLLS